MKPAALPNRFDSPWERGASAYGLLVFLFYLAVNLPGRAREPAEWFFWLELVAVFPPLFWRVLDPTMGSIRRLLAVGGGVHLAFSQFSSSYDFFARATLGSVFEWSHLPLSAVASLATLGGCYWIGRALSRRIAIPKLIAAGFVLGITRTGENLVGFPLFHVRHLIDVLIFAGFAWFSWTVFFGKRATSGYSPKAKKLWVLFFIAWALQPIAQLTPSSLHHYSFFAGPMELVRMGGRLLYDVPAQYGFLSILVPAALPFSAMKSFQIVMGLMLAAQAWLVLEGLLSLPLKRFRLTWAGLTAFVVVFLLPGDHSDLGAFTYPNTAAFRFFPAVVAAWLLAKRDKTPLWALALAFVVGSFWALESAMFCFGAWGYAVAAETLAVANGSRPFDELKKAAPRILTPVASVLVFAAVIEVFYRTYFGVAPEWGAFREFSKQYAETFAISPIDPRGALNLLLAFIALYGSCLIVELRRTRGRDLAGNFAFLGLIVATFAYFIARSDAINAITLIALWIAVFFSALPLLSSQLSGEWKSAVVIGAFLFSVVFVPFSLPNPVKRNLGRYVRQWAMVAGVRPLDDIYPALAAVESVRDRTLPFLNLTENKFLVPSISVESFPYVPFSPIHPAEQFIILPRERRDVYMERFMAWHTPPRVQVLRGSKEDEFSVSSLEKLGSRYSLEARVAATPELWLETYRLK